MNKKVIVLGVDGASPTFIKKMIDEGKLPSFEKLIKEGVWAPYCLSSIPTSTPENWTTIATGAWNGTHQVMSFQVFRLPETYGRWVAGYTSKECRAEFIWDAVERAGKRCILIKYPASWPPTMKNGIQICGCHVRPCVHQIDGAHYFSTVEPRNAELKLKPIDKKINGLPVLHGVLHFKARGIGGEIIGEGLDERSRLYGVPDSEEKPPRGIGLHTPVCKLLPPGKKFYLKIFSSDGRRYDKVIISRDVNGLDKIAELSPGQWSDWVTEKFNTIGGLREGTLRFRLEKLSPDAKVVGIYATQIMDIDHYTMPESIGRELFENVGPFITDIGWEGLGHDWRNAWFSTEVMEDLVEYQHQWIFKAMKYLCSTREWVLCMTQTHCIDCANHHALAFTDPEYDAPIELRKHYIGFIERLYQSVDRLLGKILDWIDENTVLIVVSDHGGLPGYRRINTNKVLEKAGLLKFNEDGSIDWNHTRAYVQNAVFINVNLKGREPYGIVPPEKYEKTRDEIIAALHSYIDDKTGLHPYNLVLRKEDARYIGLYGDPTYKKIGDIVFTLKEPFGGTHGEQLSTARWGINSNGCFLAIRGPNIRKGLVLERTVWLTDITPTICYILNIPPPRDAEGAIIYQIFEEFSW